MDTMLRAPIAKCYSQQPRSYGLFWLPRGTKAVTHMYKRDSLGKDGTKEANNKSGEIRSNKDLLTALKY